MKEITIIKADINEIKTKILMRYNKTKTWFLAGQVRRRKTEKRESSTD